MNFYHFTTSTMVSSSEVEVVAYSMRASEDSEVILRDGDTALDDGAAFILLGKDQSIFVEPNVSFPNGLYVDVVSGDVEGSIWIR